MKTSVKVHLEHFRSHSAKDAFLAPTLRMAKRWRHWQELGGIQSFHLELILTFLVVRDGPAPTLEESFRRLFLFVIGDLSAGVAFDKGNATRFTTPVVIVDPANDDNNVAARIELGERDELIQAARTAYETLTWAQGLPGKGDRKLIDATLVSTPSTEKTSGACTQPSPPITESRRSQPSCTPVNTWTRTLPPSRPSRKSNT